MIGLQKAFGSVSAVEDLSLDVSPGEFVTILGPSGSGKSTTLAMIAGFERPDRGDIQIDGRSVIHDPPHRRDVGIVFQHYALFPHMNVFENVAFPLKMRGVGKGELKPRVQAELDRVGLPGVGNRRPKQLSGGQQQRVALARCLVFHPKVLLMDEPLGALDRKLRIGMQLELKRLQRELLMTVIHVTHDQEEALSLSDRIAVMNEGRLEQVGTPSDLYDSPATLFVADFVGEANFIDVRVEELHAAWAVGMTKGGLPVGFAHNGRAQRGEEVQLAIRGEQLEIMREPDPELGTLSKTKGDTDRTTRTNVWPASVKDVVFRGDVIVYHIQLMDGTMVAVKRQNDTGREIWSVEERVVIRSGWRSVKAVE